MTNPAINRRIAAISDIHGCVDALDAVLEDIARCEIAEVWCLGDIVGHGGDPVGCVDRIEQTCSVILSGNHDLVITERLQSRNTDPEVVAIIEKCRTQLVEAGGGRYERLGARPSEVVVGNIVLAHGCPAPFDSARNYIEQDVAPSAVFDACREANTVLVGHTHLPALWTDAGSDVVRPSVGAASTTMAVAARARCIVNVGSVGQSFDGDPRPMWTELELDALNSLVSVSWTRLLPGDRSRMQPPQRRAVLVQRRVR